MNDHADGELSPEASGTKDEGEKVNKFATLSLVGESMSVVLAFEPVIESSDWDENLPHHYHRTVRKLVSRTREFANIDLVLAGRRFEPLDVYQTLENLGVDYLLPKIKRSSEFEVTGSDGEKLQRIFSLGRDGSREVYVLGSSVIGSETSPAGASTASFQPSDASIENADFWLRLRTLAEYTLYVARGF